MARSKNNYKDKNNDQKKHSGASFKMIDGNPIISAWKKNAQGFHKLYARPYKKTKRTTSANGKNWVNLFVTIHNLTAMTSSNFTGMYDADRRRLYIKDINQIVTTNGKGGYFGKHL